MFTVYIWLPLRLAWGFRCFQIAMGTSENPGKPRLPLPHVELRREPTVLCRKNGSSPRNSLAHQCGIMWVCPETLGCSKNSKDGSLTIIDLIDSLMNHWIFGCPIFKANPRGCVFATRFASPKSGQRFAHMRSLKQCLVEALRWSQTALWSQLLAQECTFRHMNIANLAVENPDFFNRWKSTSRWRMSL